MKFLLRLKAWQLFLMIIVAAILSLFPVIGIIFLAMSIFLYFGWVYAIGMAMNNLMMESVRPNVTYFKYSCLFGGIVYFISELVQGGIIHLGISEQSYLYWIWDAMLLYASWSLLYCISFAARMLDSVIENQMVGFGGSFLTFICIIAFPWGMWSIQRNVKQALEA